MKKLIVLVSALLLVAMVAGADTTITGKVEYRWAQDFGDKAFTDAKVVEVKINATVDDYNTLYIELEEGPTTETDVTSLGVFGLDRANFTTDFGALLELPVGVKVKSGFDEWKGGSDSSKVTLGEWEDRIGAGFKGWGQQVEIMAADMLTIESAWTWDFSEKEFTVGAYGTVAPVSYEVAYTTLGVEPADGRIDGGAKFAMDVADGINVAAAADINYDLGTEVYQYGVGLQVAYNNVVWAGLGFRGDDVNAADSIQIGLKAAPVADSSLAIFAFAGIGLEDTVYADAFDSAEFSLFYKFGASEWYLGYFWSSANAEYIAKEKNDLTPGGGEEGAIFLRAALSF